MNTKQHTLEWPSNIPREEYYAVFTNRPFGIQLKPYYTHKKGAYVSKVGPAASGKVKLCSVILSVNGERIKKHTTASLVNSIQRASLPCRIRFASGEPPAHDILEKMKQGREGSDKDKKQRDMQELAEEFMNEFDGMNFIRRARVSERNHEWRDAIKFYELGITKSRQHLLRLKLAKSDRRMVMDQLNVYDRKLSILCQKHQRRVRSETHRRSTTNYNNNDGYDEDQKTKEDNKNRRCVYTRQTKQQQQDEAFRTRISADIIDEKPDVTFKDVQGLESVKLALYESIILPALRPDVFTGLRSPATGLLLFGPPGNGKTMIAKCVAAECDCTFFSISASSITSKFVGDAERIMRMLFEIAREKAPSIIFIDEIDSLLTARGGKNEAESSRRIKTEFLIQFDGVKASTDSSSHVLVIGATNLPEQLDEAVLRRFQKRILVPLPDEDTRGGLLRSLIRKQKHELSDNDFDRVVKASKGYSCSDLANVCKDAAMGPVRDLGAAILDPNAKMGNISVKHFQDSLRNVKPSLPPDSVLEYDKWNDSFGSKMQLAISALPESMRPRDPNEEPPQPEPEPEPEMNSEDEGDFPDISDEGSGSGIGSDRSF